MLLDRSDVALIRRLLADPRATWDDLASTTSETIEGAKERYADLVRREIIDPRLDVAPLARGERFTWMVHVAASDPSQSGISQLVARASQMAGVERVVEVAGEYDLVLTVSTQEPDASGITSALLQQGASEVRRVMVLRSTRLDPTLPDPSPVDPGSGGRRVRRHTDD